MVKATGYKGRILDLWFQDDPILVARRAAGEQEVTESIRRGPYYKAFADVVAIRPIRRDSRGVWQATKDIQMVKG